MEDRWDRTLAWAAAHGAEAAQVVNETLEGFDTGLLGRNGREGLAWRLEASGAHVDGLQVEDCCSLDVQDHRLNEEEYAALQVARGARELADKASEFAWSAMSRSTHEVAEVAENAADLAEEAAEKAMAEWAGVEAEAIERLIREDLEVQVD